MKKLLLATTATAMMAGAAFADGHAAEVKLGIILGFTGPIESITPMMADGAEVAMKEVTDSGMLLDGAKVTPVRADSTCIDAAAATAAAERLITSDGVKGIMGADCSGVTGAILANVALANGVVMVSPSATSPGLSTAEDNGLFFRTAPSDARQGVVMTEVLMDQGIKSVALTYTNNDYGKGLADAFQAALKALAAKSPSLPRMKTARRITLLKLARWPRPVVTAWWLQAMSTKVAPVSYVPRWMRARLTRSTSPMA